VPLLAARSSIASISHVKYCAQLWLLRHGRLTALRAMRFIAVNVLAVNALHASLSAFEVTVVDKPHVGVSRF
jgi:hypothetical protein